MMNAHLLLRSEPEVRTALIQYLHAQGLILAERVVCAAGEPDLVTADHAAIYEIKYHLDRKALFHGLGQVLLYRQCINPHARAILVGYPTPDTPILLPHIEALNVEILCWEDPVEQNKQRDRIENETHPAPSRTHQGIDNHFPSLQWNVERLAMAQGCKNVPALAARMGVGRQSVYGLWRGETIQVSLDALERLNNALKTRPGDWFLQNEGSEKEWHRLQWAVGTAAEIRGFRMTTLSHKAEVHMRSLRPIWHGIAQAVSVDTLARIAYILDTIQPFAIGDLFRWADPH